MKRGQSLKRSHVWGRMSSVRCPGLHARVKEDSDGCWEKPAALDLV